MKLIPLTQGLFAMVDDADFDAVNAHKWHAKRTGRGVYAARNIRNSDGTQGYQYLHQFLMPGVAEIDHRDGNGCNDQKENLRPATRRQNVQGFRLKRPGATSKFRGVDWNKKLGKWRARITVDGTVINLGYFESETDAARTYDKAARKFFKDFASPNFP